MYSNFSLCISLASFVSASLIVNITRRCSKTCQPDNQIFADEHTSEYATRNDIAYIYTCDRYRSGAMDGVKWLEYVLYGFEWNAEIAQVNEYPKQTDCIWQSRYGSDNNEFWVVEVFLAFCVVFLAPIYRVDSVWMGHDCVCARVFGECGWNEKLSCIELKEIEMKYESRWCERIWANITLDNHLIVTHWNTQSANERHHRVINQ